MALFTDGTISTLEELRGYESAIYDVATTERIDLSQKLLLAKQELGIELTSRFFRENPGGPKQGGGDAGAAVLAPLSDAGPDLPGRLQQPSQ